jgi:hypothetical protein
MPITIAFRRDFEKGFLKRNLPGLTAEASPMRKRPFSKAADFPLFSA